MGTPQYHMPRISEELAGQHIFVTGGSGFMGKVLIEKLLRSCPDLACIYILLRPKRGASVEERLKAITSTKLFEPLLKDHPEVVTKCRAVTGDCGELGLSLSAEDEALLVENVSYVFHAAATVRFDDSLQSAILLNTRGTREVVALSKKMRKIKVLQYVSTTYCFTNEPVLKEKVYKTDLDWRKMIHLAETEDKHTMDAISQKVLGFQPNTYTFSKALAENLINDSRFDVPCIIFRPAVVISTVTEPFPGWLDNMNGPFGIWAGALKGLLRFSYGDPDVALSYTPVDWAIRGMIICAVAKAVQSPALSFNMTENNSEVDVLNMEGSSYERQTYGLQKETLPNCYLYGPNPIRYPSYHIGRSYLYYWLGTVLSELPYGLAIDLLLRVSGQKPRMISLHRKIFSANAALAYFMLNEFPIETGKIDQLHDTLQAGDKASFGVILNGVDSNFNYNLEEYQSAVLKGAFLYVLNESTTEEETALRLKWLFALEIVIKITMACFLYLAFGGFVCSRLTRLGENLMIL